MLLLPSQHNPAPVFARGEGAVPSSSRLVHPAPSTAGCGYTGACRGTPVLPARCGASDPQGMAWSRPRCRIWPAAAGFSLKSKRVWQPRNHDSVPRACPHPSGCLRRRCRQHPAPRLVQPAFPYPQGPTGVLSWAPARGGSAVPFLTRAFTGRQSQFPKEPSPSMTLHLRLLAGQIPSSTPKPRPRCGRQHRCRSCQPD